LKRIPQALRDVAALRRQQERQQEYDGAIILLRSRVNMIKDAVPEGNEYWGTIGFLPLVDSRPNASTSCDIAVTYHEGRPIELKFTHRT